MPSPTATGFIVLSTQRTGSHLLRSVIASHPDFVHVGEALMPETPKPGSYDAFLAETARSTDPRLLWDEYLEHLRGQKPSANHVGLLVKYEHVDRIMGRDLTTDPVFQAVRIIHLVRHNVLRMVASHYLAVARGLHVAMEPVEHEIHSIEIPADGVLGILRKKAAAMQTFRERLAGRPGVIEVAYEDIMDGESIDSELIGELCRFFDVDDQFTPHPGTFKLASNQLRTVISNYDEITTILAGTEFEKMLE